MASAAPPDPAVSNAEFPRDHPDGLLIVAWADGTEAAS
jgi:hypothetical protein